MHARVGNGKVSEIGSLPVKFSDNGKNGKHEMKVMKAKKRIEKESQWANSQMWNDLSMLLLHVLMCFWFVLCICLQCIDRSFLRNKSDYDRLGRMQAGWHSS